MAENLTNYLTGFSAQSLTREVAKASFGPNFAICNLEINIIAFKGKPDPENLCLFGLPQ
jgi:hypothetical protein